MAERNIYWDTLKWLGGKYTDMVGKGFRAKPTIEMDKVSTLTVAFAGLNLLTPLLTSRGKSPKDIAKDFGVNAFTVFGTLGMKSPLKQGLWNIAFMGSKGLSHGLVALNQTYRYGLDARTSAMIPFSHSTVPMDQAFATFQYAQASMGGMRGIIGNEAAMYAARYLQR